MAAPPNPSASDAPLAFTSDPLVEVGVAGASLQREYERRSAVRAEATRAKHPRLGGLILALTNEPQTTTAFTSGADGERRAAATTIERAGDDALFLLNRTLGRGRRDGDIDILAIGPAGIYVIDVKRYAGATVEVRRTGGLLRPKREQLYIAGRDKTGLLASLRRQVDAVQAALAGDLSHASVAVRAVFCFVDAELPLLSKLSIAGVPVLGAKGTARLVANAGELDAAHRAALHSHLAELLPAAT